MFEGIASFIGKSGFTGASGFTGFSGIRGKVNAVFSYAFYQTNSSLAIKDLVTGYIQLQTDRASSQNVVQSDGTVISYADDIAAFNVGVGPKGEPEGTNSCGYSQDFTQQILLTNITATSTTESTPLSLGNVGSLFTCDTSLGGHRLVYRFVAGTASQPIHITQIVKRTGYEWYQITTSAESTSYVNINLSTLAIGNSASGTAPITITKAEFLSDDWIELGCYFTPLATTNHDLFLIMLEGDTATRAPSFTGDGTSTLSVCHRQYEDNATTGSSPIYTSGGSPSTRLAPLYTTATSTAWVDPNHGQSGTGTFALAGKYAGLESVNMIGTVWRNSAGAITAEITAAVAATSITVTGTVSTTDTLDWSTSDYALLDLGATGAGLTAIKALQLAADPTFVAIDQPTNDFIVEFDVILDRYQANTGIWGVVDLFDTDISGIYVKNTTTVTALINTGGTPTEIDVTVPTLSDGSRITGKFTKKSSGASTLTVNGVTDTATMTAPFQYGAVNLLTPTSLWFAASADATLISWSIRDA